MQCATLPLLIDGIFTTNYVNLWHYLNHQQASFVFEFRLSIQMQYLAQVLNMHIYLHRD